MKFKTLLSITLLMAFSIASTNCSTTVRTKSTTAKSKPLPPGKAKKINGDQSAKRYAPGQNKS